MGDTQWSLITATSVPPAHTAPGGQALQIPSPLTLYWPTGHGVQVCSPFFSPALQTGSRMYVPSQVAPAGHGVQAAAPVLGWYVVAGHLVHAMLPLPAE